MGRTLTIWLVIAGAICGRAAAGIDVPQLPALRPAPLSDFYGTLRAFGSGDSLSSEPASLRNAGVRLALLTEQLPESLPLRTPANTVLIAHRKNPKYREAIERLLWRRLDPALSCVTTTEELNAALDRIAVELRPLCGTRADSVRASLRDLYKQDYPSFLATTWPAREHPMDQWIGAVTGAIRPHESALLAELGRLLGFSIPDTSRVRILVVGRDATPADSDPVVRSGVATIVVPARPVFEREAALDLLCEYLHACDAILPDNAASATRLLAESVQGSQSPHLAKELSRSLLRYAVSKELAAIYGWDGIVSLPADAARAASYKKNWDAYAAGAIPLSTACAAIGSDASGGGK